MFLVVFSSLVVAPRGGWGAEALENVGEGFTWETEAWFGFIELCPDDRAFFGERDDVGGAAHEHRGGAEGEGEDAGVFVLKVGPEITNHLPETGASTEISEVGRTKSFVFIREVVAPCLSGISVLNFLAKILSTWKCGSDSL